MTKRQQNKIDKPKRKYHRKAKRGPKPLFKDEATKERLINAIRRGLPIKYACSCAGVGEGTFYKWKQQLGDSSSRGNCKEIRELFESIEKAKADFIDSQVGNIATAGQKSWQASAWLLERRFPDDFGSKAEGEDAKDGNSGNDRILASVRELADKETDDGGN